MKVAREAKADGKGFLRYIERREDDQRRERVLSAIDDSDPAELNEVRLDELYKYFFYNKVHKCQTANIRYKTLRSDAIYIKTIHRTKKKVFTEYYGQGGRNLG